MQQGRPAPRPVSQEQKKFMLFQMIYLMVSLSMIFVITSASLRSSIGLGLNSIFYPLVGFQGQYPILTIVVSGIMIGIIMSVPRYFFTDWLRMGRIQNRSRAFSKAYREAMAKNQRDKLQKMRKLQMDMMVESQMVSMNTLKPLMVLTIFIFLFFIWLYVFVADLSYQLITLPWASNVNIATSSVWVFPSWIVIYMFSNLTIGYFTTMIIKYVDFSYKLKKAESSESAIS
ncbi:MAG: EMC3/TMCO1 family protein [Candidatus Thermoplasmatota archaeon]|nr:EMC3/TMCO1 family protein [Candidatus Thermoplasmatota archaeon]MCL5794209.1 EMC3/TMCO1 family protein [Candidatus Thermoplasmatota archaeon]